MKESYRQALIKWNVILCPRCRGWVIAHHIDTNVHCSTCWDKCWKIIRCGK